MEMSSSVLSPFLILTLKKDSAVEWYIDHPKQTQTKKSFQMVAVLKACTQHPTEEVYLQEELLELWSVVLCSSFALGQQYTLWNLDLQLADQQRETKTTTYSDHCALKVCEQMWGAGLWYAKLGCFSSMYSQVSQSGGRVNYVHCNNTFQFVFNSLTKMILSSCTTNHEDQNFTDFFCFPWLLSCTWYVTPFVNKKKRQNRMVGTWICTTYNRKKSEIFKKKWKAETIPSKLWDKLQLYLVPHNFIVGIVVHAGDIQLSSVENVISPFNDYLFA